MFRVLPFGLLRFIKNDVPVNEKVEKYGDLSGCIHR